MPFQVTTLMENHTALDCLASEHGLSLLIEGNGRRVLYDTGASPRFLKNAKTLQAALTPLDALVLSHGHYDHTGGMSALLGTAVRPAAIYLGRHFFEERYSRKEYGLEEIGAAAAPETVDAFGCPVVEVGPEPIDLGGGVWVVSGFSTTQEMELPSPKLIRRRGGKLEPDSFEDETALVLETERELVLISGCAHVGVLSMAGRVSRLFGRPVTAFLGGTHLVNAEDRRIEGTCTLLRELGVKRLGACHCSGERAVAYFQENFPGFFQNHVGSRVEIL